MSRLSRNVGSLISYNPIGLYAFYGDRFSFLPLYSTPSKKMRSAFREVSSLQIITVPGYYGIIAYFWKQFENFRQEEAARGGGRTMA
jgi:hypothetical protein